MKRTLARLGKLFLVTLFVGMAFASNAQTPEIDAINQKMQTAKSNADKHYNETVKLMKQAGTIRSDQKLTAAQEALFVKAAAEKLLYTGFLVEYYDLENQKRILAGAVYDKRKR